MADLGFEGPLAGQQAYFAGQQALRAGQQGIEAGDIANRYNEQRIGLERQNAQRQQLDAESLARHRDALTDQTRQQIALARTAAEREQATQDLMRQIWNSALPKQSPGQPGGPPGQPGGPQGGPPGQPGGPQGGGEQSSADPMLDMVEQQRVFAEGLARAGLHSQSADVMKNVTEQFGKLSTARMHETTDRSNRLDMAHKVAVNVNQVVQGINDDASYQRGKMIIMSNSPGMKMPDWFSLPYQYAKPYIDQLKNSSKEAAQYIQIKSETSKNQAMAKEQEALARLNETRAKLEQMELDAARARTAAAVKAGEPPPSVKHPGKGSDKSTAAERMNADQMIRAGNEMYTGFDEILKVGPANMGTFADLAYTKDPGFISGAKKWLANSITEDEMHMYAARLAGVNVSAAIIASGGRAPRVSQMEAEQAAIASLSGQSREVFFDKIHQATLKAIRGVEITRAGSPEQQANLDLITTRLKGIEKQTATALGIASNYKEGSPTSPSAKSAGAQPNIGKDAYDKLKPGDKFWWNGEELTKK